MELKFNSWTMSEALKSYAGSENFKLEKKRLRQPSNLSEVPQLTQKSEGSHCSVTGALSGYTRYDDIGFMHLRQCYLSISSFLPILRRHCQ